MWIEKMKKSLEISVLSMQKFVLITLNIIIFSNKIISVHIYY